MPPKKKSVSLPQVDLSPWRGDLVDPELDFTPLEAFKPSGSFKMDFLQCCELLHIPPHPCIVPRMANPKEK